MKLSHIFLLNLVLFWSCTNDSADQSSVNQKIAEVETNLIVPVYFEGDSSWTIEERMEHYGVPGESLAVIHNGELAWSKTYGVTDKELKTPVTGRTLFQAASISKPVSAYAALRLVEQGKIDMNADIN